MDTPELPISPEALGLTAPSLQECLTELIVLSLYAKHIHWNVRGRQFRTLHLQLDELADLARTRADDVAERLVAIGGSPDGRPEAPAVTHLLRTVRLGPIWDREAAHLMERSLHSTDRTLRSAIGEVAVSDPVSQDLLIAIAAEVEKLWWMVRSEDDGIPRTVEQ